MRTEERDAAYLWDILDSAQTILKFTTGIDYNAYLEDRKLQLAIERCVEVIGEAAKNISETFKEKHLEIPWRSIVAQRDVIAHEYGEIKQDKMWALVEKKIPELAALIKPLVPPLPSEKE